MDMIAGVRLGGVEDQDLEELLEIAVELAKGADAVLVVEHKCRLVRVLPV